MVRRPRAALSPFTASPVAIHHSGRLGGGRTASNVPHTPNTKRPERGAFLWERERPARKSAGTLGGSGKTDDCDGHDAGAMNRAPTVALCHRRGAIYCALMGYVQGGRKRGTTNALHPTAQSARMGRFFMGARASRSQECGQDARAPSLTNSLRPRLRRRLHVASTSPQCGSEAKRCFASHWGGFRLRLPKLRFGFPPPPSLGEGGLRQAPSPRDLSA